MNRRETIKALAATALLPVLPAGFFPLVLPLPPHSPESIAVLMKSYLKKAAIADDLSLPEPWRVLHQHMASLRLCSLAYPHSDAITRLEAISARWPRLKPNIDLVIKARLSGQAHWSMTSDNCSYRRICTEEDDQWFDALQQSFIDRRAAKGVLNA
jgi:hypothetical protein